MKAGYRAKVCCRLLGVRSPGNNKYKNRVLSPTQMRRQWLTGLIREVHTASRQPHRLTSVNDYDVKVVKLQGEFVWHTHPDTDELFLVINGTLTIQLRDCDVVLGPHDVFVVPKGVEHCPRADAEVQVVLFEPQGTVNTGDTSGDMTSPLREFV